MTIGVGVATMGAGFPIVATVGFVAYENGSEGQPATKIQPGGLF
jgi:hypothetical protein